MYPNIEKCCNDKEEVIVRYVPDGFHVSLYTVLRNGLSREVSSGSGATIGEAMKELDSRLTGLDIHWVRKR